MRDARIPGAPHALPSYAGMPHAGTKKMCCKNMKI